ncbi:hypothetical protein N9W34_01950 [Rickettsiales bacterium]|nr:hypothetical protein [Rickettsiales bacterium]
MSTTISEGTREGNFSAFGIKNMVKESESEKVKEIGFGGSFGSFVETSSKRDNGKKKWVEKTSIIGADLNRHKSGEINLSKRTLGEYKALNKKCGPEHAIITEIVGCGINRILTEGSGPKVVLCKNDQGDFYMRSRVSKDHADLYNLVIEEEYEKLSKSSKHHPCSGIKGLTESLVIRLFMGDSLDDIKLENIVASMNFDEDKNEYCQIYNVDGGNFLHHTYNIGQEIFDPDYILGMNSYYDKENSDYKGAYRYKFRTYEDYKQNAKLVDQKKSNKGNSASLKNGLLKSFRQSKENGFVEGFRDFLNDKILKEDLAEAVDKIAHLPLDVIKQDIDKFKILRTKDDKPLITEEFADDLLYHVRHAKGKAEALMVQFREKNPEFPEFDMNKYPILAEYCDSYKDLEQDCSAERSEPEIKEPAEGHWVGVAYRQSIENIDREIGFGII